MQDSGKDFCYNNYYEASTRLTLHGGMSSLYMYSEVYLSPFSICNDNQYLITELELKVVRNSTLDINNYMDRRSNSPLTTSSPSFGFTRSTRKRYSPKFRYKTKDMNRQLAEEASKLEQLSKYPK